jgi:hypothetical protein
MLSIDGDLHVVADNAGAAAARGHRAAIGISQGDLLVGRSEHLLLVSGKLAHFLLQLRQFFGKPRHLLGQRLTRFLSIGRVKLAQIARDALPQLSTSPFHFRSCEVPVPVVHGLELAAPCDFALRIMCAIFRYRGRPSYSSIAGVWIIPE